MRISGGIGEKIHFHKTIIKILVLNIRIRYSGISPVIRRNVMKYGPSAFPKKRMCRKINEVKTDKIFF
jgi:hypothetical protein